MPTQINSTTFDQNDAKYHVCCGSVHIKIAARVVSLVCIAAAFCNVVYATARGITVAFYSWVSFSFASAIFGCLVYGVFKEKRIYMLPYLLFQVTSADLSKVQTEYSKQVDKVVFLEQNPQAASIAMTAISLFVFIIGIALSEKMLLRLAEDFGGVNANVVENPYIVSVIYRFREFLRDRENSFSFNLEGVFQTASSVYGTSVEELDIVSGPPGYNTLK
uniref:MARVEL domain-containing protein n=1 Tax=Parascaris equorum TaxID=6256 RepID=A0A914SEX1_PAREQ